MKKRMHLPPVFGCAELADFLGWSTRRVRNWCKRSEIGLQRIPCGRIEITYAQLLDKAPDVYYALLSAGAMASDTHVGKVEYLEQETCGDLRRPAET